MHPLGIQNKTREAVIASAGNYDRANSELTGEQRTTIL